MAQSTCRRAAKLAKDPIADDGLVVKVVEPVVRGAEHRIEIERTHYRSTGARYRVTYLGETLVESARDPEFEACRALLAKGVTGTMVTYSHGSSVPRLRVDIEKGAKLATIDNANDGPRFGRYRPHPNGGKGDDGE